MKKRCAKCGEEKHLDEFHRNKHKKDGHHHICRDCNNAQDRERHAKNCVKYNTQKRLYRANNPEKRRNWNKKYREKDPEKTRKQKRKCYEKNLEKYRKHDRERWSVKKAEKALINLLKIKDIIRNKFMKGKTDGEKK